MNKLKVRNLFITLAYILSLLIINNKFLLAHTTKIMLIETTVKPFSTWPPGCYRDEKTTCDCYSDVELKCKIVDGLNSISIRFYRNHRYLLVTCYTIDTGTNIDFLLKRKFPKILLETRYIGVNDCKNFTHESYINDKVWVTQQNMNELNKVTVIFNIDFNTKPTGYFSTEWKFTHLQLIIKSNRTEIREADVIYIFTDSLDTPPQMETLTLSVQGLRNQTLSLQNLTQTVFKHFTMLRQLDLAGNNMKMLDAKIFATLTQLNFLNLSRNEIRELPESLLAYQHHLLILDLSHNLLEYLTPHLFNNTPWLWQLKLAGNHLHDTVDLMENLKPLNYLHRLDISQNQLQTNWSTKTSGNRTPKLLTTFRHNMSSDLVEVLNYITKLHSENYEDGKINSTIINLSGNRLREFTLDWLVAANLICPFEINLEHNMIENIFALQDLFGMTDDCALEIKLSGHRIACDCKLAWIYRENYRSLFNDFQCIQTSTKQVKNLAQLKRNELCTWEPVMCPRNCNCYTQFEFLHINCKGAQHIEQLPRPEQVGLKSSVLDISNNNFIELPLNTTFGYDNVSQLNASSNKITNFNISQLPTNLTVLDLRNNRLKSLDDEFLRRYLNDSTKLLYLYLSDNHWICDCSTQQLVYTIRRHQTRIPDADQLLCYSTTLQNDTLLIDNVREMCPTPVKDEYYQNLNATVISVASTIIILLCIIALFYKYKLEVKVWLYSYNILRFCISECELDKHKTFDAFISYAHQDADFVNHTLLPQLEQCEPPFRVCTHERNWLAGAYIPEQIIESVEQSRRTIIVLSQHFIESDWARMEFRTAHQCSLNEGRARIIMIKYGEITKTDLLDRELRAYLAMNTYLDWQDVRFWDKLRYAMPHKVRREKSSDMLKTNGRMYVIRQVEVNRLHEEIHVPREEKFLADMTREDIDEILLDRELDDDDLIEIATEVIESENGSDTDIDEHPIKAETIKQGLKLAAELENYFVANDTDAERTRIFQKELSLCMLRYKELHRNLLGPKRSVQTKLTEFMVQTQSEMLSQSEHQSIVLTIDSDTNSSDISAGHQNKRLRIISTMDNENTETNIDFLLKRKFRTILLETRYIGVKDCKNFTHEIYINDKVWVSQQNMNELNKVTVIFNIDFNAKSLEYIRIKWTFTHLQLIIKSNRTEIWESDVIYIFIESLNTPPQLETFTLSVQGLRNQTLSLQNLTQTVFKHFTMLRQLDLAGNNMKMLDENIFAALTQLNFLNLSRNEIRELPESLLAYQHQLLILDLSYNLLEYLTPHLFDHTPWLWQLKLAGNHLHDIIHLIENLKPLNYLHRLDVSQNQLQTIWSTDTSVNRTPRLLTNFRYNMSLALADSLNYITKLQPENYEGGKINSTVINLSGNRLREFTLDWLVAANLICPFEINLDHNSIENIFALQKTDDCAPKIKLNGNPIVCDCILAWIYSENYRSLFNGLQCLQTSTKQVKDLAQLERNELCAWEPVMCPRNCNCYTQFEFLHIDCKGAQHIEQLPRPEQVGLKSSVLDISNNNFIELPLNTTFGYGNVSQLNASSNKITNFNISQLPTNLTVLDLRNNRLKSLDDEFLRRYLNDSTKLQYLYLSDNHWICDCSTQQLVYTIRTHQTRIPDADQLLCYSTTLKNDTRLIDNVRELCPTPVNVEYYKNLNTTVISVALTIIVLLCIIALFYKYKLEVEVWLYSHNILRFCISECELDKHKTFDAFISYAHQDADFVNHTLLPQLEQCEPPFRICTHERNWLAGAYIPEQIIESVEQSRRTIIVLSQHFIESDWARMEFRTAHQCSLNEGRARIIMIKYGEITKSDLLDRELRAYLAMNTYLDWQDVRFWDKLRYAMPHKVRREKSSDMLKTNGRMYVIRQVEVNRLHEEIV
ncbi:uncharacterized protein LOC125775845 [Bactrocera dorsalis]|uniref:Uncharacterized protein LOC125775845 n=1 Tax=Bactrocera dorsalis TaxID=27457 RepID=A0ABM3J0Q2_BACDO|nr:uncharacterized protein LOC125775845 [Bactrocera dorsalis]